MTYQKKILLIVKQFSSHNYTEEYYFHFLFFEKGAIEMEEKQSIDPKLASEHESEPHSSDNFSDIVLLESVSPPPVNELECCASFENYSVLIYRLFTDATASIAAFIVNIIILILILTSSISLIIESLPKYRVLCFHIIDTNELLKNNILFD